MLNRRLNNNQDTAISWVRAHVQIPGNEEADTLANLSSHLGETTGTKRLVTEGGLRTSGKTERSVARKRESYRLGTAINWSRRALSAYTWMRTENGPQKQWLYFIGKTDTPYCSCNPQTIQSGAHITFSCPHHALACQKLTANRQSWEELDTPHWIKTGPNEFEDGVATFFDYLFHQLV